MRQILLSAMIALASLAVSAPVAARVIAQSDNSFVIHQSVEVPVKPMEAWDVLIRPSLWWGDKQTFSGDAANLSLGPRAGGCLCEILPNKDSPKAAPRGSVEHMRVVYAEDGRALRMIGALGPMQAEAVNAVMTIVLKPNEHGTEILLEYVVSGYLRKKGLAQATDQMITDLVLRLAEKLGGVPEEVGTAKEEGFEGESGDNVLPRIEPKDVPIGDTGVEGPPDDTPPANPDNTGQPYIGR